MGSQLVQGKHIAIGTRTVVLDGGGRLRRSPQSAVESVDQRIEVLGLKLIDAAEVGDDLLTHLAGVVAEGLDDLEVGAAAGAGQTRVHVTTIADIKSICKSLRAIDVTRQNFSKTGA
jgi:hypothetical protein